MKKLISLSLAGVLALGMSLDSAFAARVNPVNFKEIRGKNRYVTSVNLSKEAYSTSASTVVVASGRNFPDALAGGPLASALKGPLLLTDTKSLPAEVKYEIQRLKPSKIVILGGYGSVSQNVENSLKELVRNTTRINGRDRYATSVLVAKEVRSLGKANDMKTIVVSGKVFADALSAGALGSKLKAPLVLTDGKSLPQGYYDVMLSGSSDNNIIVGGSSSVNVPGLSGTRVSGSDRYETAAKIAENYFSSPKNIALASGIDFPDGLASVTLYNTFESPILLSKKDSVSSSVKSYITKKNVKKAFIVGGTNSIGSSVRSAVKNAVDDNMYKLDRPTIVNGVGEGQSTVNVRLDEKAKEAGEVSVYKVDSNNDVVGNSIGTAKYYKGADSNYVVTVSLGVVLQRGDKVVAKKTEGSLISDFSDIASVGGASVSSKSEFDKLKNKEVVVELTEADSNMPAKIKAAVDYKLANDKELSKNYKYEVSDVTDVGSIRGDTTRYRTPKVKLTVTNKNNSADKYTGDYDKLRVNIVYDKVIGLSFDKESYSVVKGDNAGTNLVITPLVSGKVSDLRLSVSALDDKNNAYSVNSSYSSSTGKTTVNVKVANSNSTVKSIVVTAVYDKNGTKYTKSATVNVADRAVEDMTLTNNVSGSPGLVDMKDGRYAIEIYPSDLKNQEFIATLKGKGNVSGVDAANSFSGTVELTESNDFSPSDIKINIKFEDVKDSNGKPTGKVKVKVTDSTNADGKPYSYRYRIQYYDGSTTVAKQISVNVKRR